MFILSSFGVASPLRNEIVVKLHSDIAWESLVGSLLTAVVVIISVIISFRGIKNTIQSQENIASTSMRIEVLSKNRQAWINELRTYCAQFLSMSMKIRSSERVTLTTLGMVEGGG